MMIASFFFPAKIYDEEKISLPIWNTLCEGVKNHP